MKVQALKTRIFKEKELLLPFIEKYTGKPKEKSILVVTSKIVALSEGRTVTANDKKTRERVIIEESEFAMPTKYTWLTIKDGMVMMSAGVDESNANGKIILLPKDSFKQAESIRNYLKKKYKLKKFGVIITDSRCLPLRAGITGVALAYAGFRGLKSYVGTPDIFGRILNLSTVDSADSLATAAVFCMGEGKEQRPLAVISEVDVEWCETVRRNELWIDPKEDVYQPLFETIRKLDYKKKKQRS